MGWQLNPTDRALVRSQRGPMASIPFQYTTCLCRIPFRQCFRVLLLRRLWCQFPLSSAAAGVASHSILVATTGEFAPPRVLGRRGYPLESCAARICREAGARVSVNIRVQEPVPRADNRRLEVVADGLPSFMAHSWPWTPKVSTVRADGAPRRQSERDGAALDQARRTKERTYPELTGEHGRAVLPCEEEDGPRNPARSSGSWPERGPGRSP